MKKMIQYEIYTDGSSKQMEGMRFGGWAFIIVKGDKVIYQEYGSKSDATNQQMELFAAIKGLEWVSEHRANDETAILYSDSAYLINCYKMKWYETWKRNGWQTAKKEPVKNEELWWRLLPFFENWNYSFIHVKGHAENYYNNLCDEMAQKGADEAKGGQFNGTRHKNIQPPVRG